MTFKTLTAVALIMASLPVAGFAQTERPRMTPPTLDFATADADGSGGISAEEWTAYSATLRDGMRAQFTAARADALLEAADADGNGTLTRDELIAGMTALGDERREARGERMGEMGGMGRHHGRWGGDEGHGPRGGWHHGRGGDERGPRGERHAERGPRGEMHDGMRGEMRPGMGEGMRGGPMGGDGMAERSFARMDRNDDGSIDATELAQAQEFLNWMAARPRFN